MTSNLKITVIGTGYVGLVSGVCFSELGHHVTCIDNNSYKVQQLQQGVIPIYEPGLDVLAEKNIKAGRLIFSDDLNAHIKGSDAVFIAVGTPTATDGVSADLSAVFAVARSLAPHLHDYMVIVTKSTVPVLTNKAIEEKILSLNPRANFDICSNPEFLREGSAIEDFMNPDRIVIGVRTEKAKQVLSRLYAPLTAEQVPLVVTTPESAELIKYAANAFLAMKVAFINEVADLAEATGGDIAAIAEGIGLDSRIGPKFLQAGPGYGGSCFPKDTKAFSQLAHIHNVSSQIIEAVIQSNDDRKDSMSERIMVAMGGDVSGKKIAVLGVTFKANTDDMRDSVSLDIIPQLLQAGAEVHAYDPAATEHAHSLLPQAVFWYDSAEKTLPNADALVLLTDWPEFAELNLHQATQRMDTPTLIDLRNFFPVDEAVAAGFTVYGIGKQVARPAIVTNQKIRAIR